MRARPVSSRIMPMRIGMRTVVVRSIPFTHLATIKAAARMDTTCGSTGAVVVENSRQKLTELSPLSSPNPAAMA